jgi:hypothetical protein
MAALIDQRLVYPDEKHEQVSRAKDTALMDSLGTNELLNRIDQLSDEQVSELLEEMQHEGKVG